MNDKTICYVILSWSIETFIVDNVRTYAILDSTAVIFRGVLKKLLYFFDVVKKFQ